MRLLITGGAGFVGSSLAKLFRRDFPKADIVVLDNLKRRGSELNLPFFKKLNIAFIHGDIRNFSDLEDLEKNFDFFLEASAEPSVLAGLNGSPRYVMDTNLYGTLNCLEFARKRAAAFLFLSTSRVYSIDPLKELSFEEDETRLKLSHKQNIPGASAQGIGEGFPTHLARSLYGATKLASELFVQEYASTFGLPCLINRCGVIAGPGQFGKVDQGVFTLWVANHYFKKTLSYTGFGGQGKQVRDLLHPRDLYALIRKQINDVSTWSADVFNVGGGTKVSTSLLEFTKLCQEATGNKISIGSNPQTNPVDIPFYVSDNAKVNRRYGWTPETLPVDIVNEITTWLKSNKAELKEIFA